MSREAFEAWFSDDGKYPRACERSREGGYVLAHAADAWRAWQAAQADAYERIAQIFDRRAKQANTQARMMEAQDDAYAIRALAKEA